MAFVDLEIAAGRDDLVALMTAKMEEEYPGWVASSFEKVLFAAVAEMGVQILEQASVVPATVFRTYGEKVLSLPPGNGAAASVSSTWTAVDTSGYTVPAGTQVTLTDSTGTPRVFALGSSVTIAPGGTTGTGILYADEVGTAYNGISGTPTLLDALAYVASVSITGSTSGGEDDETDDEYMDRLAAELRLLAPRPILPADFAVMARRIDGVQRALAVDGLDPTGPTTGNARTVAVACIDSAGAAVSAGIKTAVDTLLQAQREANFQVFVFDPTYTTINITATAVAHAGWSTTAVKASAEAALASRLSPALWGTPPQADSTEWVSRDKVRYLEMAGALEAVEGLDYISALTVNGGTADVTLSGYAPLPQAGTITVTVNAP